jgi:CBS domain-containing protein
MDTATISYRVADFLKKYPPFQAMDDGDVLALAGSGRVRFHERNEHLLSQGEAHKHHVFVIQQGVVSLWGEVNGAFELRDVRGTGDLLGVERFNGAPVCVHSARAATDVVTYALPAAEFETLLEKYPGARQYVAAYSTVTLDYQAADANEPDEVFLHDVVKARRVATCNQRDSIRSAAKSLRASGVDAIAVLDAEGAVCGVVTSSDLVSWLADGNTVAEQPIATLLRTPVAAVAPTASVADGVLTMGAAGAEALAMTATGTPEGELHALITTADLAGLFGDQPAAILRDVRRAAGTSELRTLNHRARAFALKYLERARSADWLARFTALVDEAIVTRVLVLAGAADTGGWCWGLSGSSGRRESLTRLAPELLLITDARQSETTDTYQCVAGLLIECDNLPHTGAPFEPSFFAADIAEWKKRFEAWVRNPILEQMYLARGLFDLRPIRGGDRLVRDIEATIAAAVDRDLLRIIANDCVARLPPLTFFQDAVVDDMGDRHSLFQLDRNALTPLVDVARVYGIAAGHVLGGSSRERFALARRLLPQHEAIFREAADTLSLVLWLQGRIGIRQGTSGTELPPTLLSRHDRQLLKSGFRVIQRLIELTSNYEWLDRV